MKPRSQIFRLGLIILGVCIGLSALAFWGSRYFLHTLPAAQFPIQITRITVEPDPIVGQPTILRVEFSSYNNEADVRLIIQWHEGIKQMGGDLTWQGSLVANQTQVYEVPICVLYEGDWQIFVTAVSQLAPDSSYSDLESVYLQSALTSGRVIPGNEYRIVQPTGGFTMPTPLPPLPANICQ